MYMSDLSWLVCPILMKSLLCSRFSQQPQWSGIPENHFTTKTNGKKVLPTFAFSLRFVKYPSVSFNSLSTFSLMFVLFLINLSTKKAVLAFHITWQSLYQVSFDFPDPVPDHSVSVFLGELNLHWQPIASFYVWVLPRYPCSPPWALPRSTEMFTWLSVFLGLEEEMLEIH